MLCHLLTKLELTASASMAQRLTDDCVSQWVKRWWPNGNSDFSKRLLNSTVLNSIVVYRQVTEINIKKLSYRIQLVKDLFMKHACAAGKQSVPGRQVSNNTITRLTKRHFLRKVALKTEKSKSSRRCVVWAQKKEIFSALLSNMWCGPLLRRLLWAVPPAAQLLS